MNIKKNTVIKGKHSKPIVTDVFYNDDKKLKKIIIFCHGYKGFKDWGAWNIMAQKFAEAGFFFIKFNFSHNGGTLENPIDFPDLEAFGNNNYTKELDDLESVINWILSEEKYTNQIQKNTISLIGHSRGGGTILLKANENDNVKKVITLAGVSDYKIRFPTGEILEKWKKDGVAYITNGRTNQQMPHFYQFYEDFVKNENRLTIKSAVKNLKIPHLIIHGDNDTSVVLAEAENLKKWNPDAKFEVIKNTDHVFNTFHPWEIESLPNEFEQIVTKSIAFLRQFTFLLNPLLFLIFLDYFSQNSLLLQLIQGCLKVYSLNYF